MNCERHQSRFFCLKIPSAHQRSRVQIRLRFGMGNGSFSREDMRISFTWKKTMDRLTFLARALLITLASWNHVSSQLSASWKGRLLDRMESCLNGIASYLQQDHQQNGLKLGYMVLTLLFIHEKHNFVAYPRPPGCTCRMQLLRFRLPAEINVFA